MPATLSHPSTTRAPARKRTRKKTIVGIDWTGTSVVVVEMLQRGADLDLKRRFFTEWPVEISLLANPEQAGAWLREQLQLHGIDAREVIVSLPRRDAALRLIELPSASPQEMAAMVRLQIAERSGISVDDLHVDFLLQPVANHSATTHALIVTFPRSSLAIIHEVMKAAGLRITACGIGELALSALDPAAADGTTSAFVLANRKKLEFVLVRHGLPVASHAVPMKSARDEAMKLLPAQINRMLQGLPQGIRTGSVSRVYLFGPNAELLLPSFTDYLDVPVRIIQSPCADSVRLFALASSLSQPPLRLDFLTARGDQTSNIAGKSTRRRVAALSLAVLCLASVLSWRQREQERQIDLLQATQQALASQIQQEAHVLAASRQLQQWQASECDWPTLWSDFATQLAKQPQAYLTRVRWRQSPQSLPLIHVDGRARDINAVLKLQAALATRGFDLEPQLIGPLNEGEYSTLFTVRAFQRNRPQ